MARYRITYFFKNTNGYGWTETLFNQAGTLDQTMVRAQTLLPFRVKLLGQGSSLQFIRVSDDEIKRDSQIYTVPNADRESKSRSFGDADIANTCLVVRLDSGPLKRRTLFLRGVPDIMVQDNGIYTPTPGYKQAVKDWGDSLSPTLMAIRIRGDDGVPINLSNVSLVAGDGTVTITTAAAHTYGPNDFVNIRGVLGATQVRGLQRVLTVPDNTHFTIRVNRVVKVYLGGGNVVRNVYSLVNIIGGQVVRASHHNAGRPFDAPRGRRLVR
jgi:hypothetical protein